VRTGERRWRWHAVPSPEEGGWWGRWAERSPWGDALGRDIAGERGDSAKYADAWRTGGGAIWTTPAFDVASGLVFFGTGNPTPEYDATKRPGDNLYTASIVALEAATGRLRWHHQYLPHDPGDYDAANPPIVVDVAGRRLVAHASKTGHVMLLDALTGEPVRRTPALVPQFQMMAAATKDGIRRSPGAGGGADWHPSAYSPATGLMYVPMLHMPMMFTTVDETPAAGRLYRRGAEATIPGDSVWTDLAAVDLASGRVAWSDRLHGGDFRSGALATAGGLVFTGGEKGWVRALDAQSGKVLWEYHCGAMVNAPPIMLRIDGVEYLIVVAGGSNYEGAWGSAVIVFGLPERWRQDDGR
jgi:glucose dehydrogenase